MKQDVAHHARIMTSEHGHERELALDVVEFGGEELGHTESTGHIGSLDVSEKREQHGGAVIESQRKRNIVVELTKNKDHTAKGTWLSRHRYSIWNHAHPPHKDTLPLASLSWN